VEILHVNYGTCKFLNKKRKNSLKSIRDLKGHEKDVRVINFDPKNPNLCCSAGNDKYILLYDLRRYIKKK
jgi:WD40 repeat protein